MTLISEIIFGGFVSKIVNDIGEISKDAIKKAVKQRNEKYQNIESQIYNVIVDVLNKITNNSYRNDQDSIYDATETMLESLKKSNEDTLKSIKSCLRVLGLKVDQSECLKFKVSLYKELGKNEYSELFRAILLLLLEKKNRYDNDVYIQLNQKLDEVILILNQKEHDGDIAKTKQKIKSRTQEYADKWEANMFLNDFDKRDQNAGTNVKLKEVYLKEHLPHYIWKDNNENTPSTDLKELLSEYINEKRDSKMLLILGQPGIGKSTLITWIAANFCEKIDDILVYRFASDLGNTDWQKERVSNRVLEELGLGYSDLNGKILIIDGFDEISIEASRRKGILDSLYIDWIYNKTIENFSLIITCRENYVSQFAILKCKYITLKPWDETQIRSFCNIFEDKSKNSVSMNMIEKLLENKEILGIPLILYMTLALNITIEKSSSIVDIYDQIFSLKKGGIYDRCYTIEHRINEPEIKKYIHQTSQKIAFWIFEHNNDKAFIKQEEFEDICNKEMDKFGKEIEDIQRDILIGNFFNLKYYEGRNTNKIYFIHRSIYEYFVVIYFFESLCCLKSKEEIVGKLGELLKDGRLTERILEIIKYKFNSIKKYSLPDITKEIFNIMLQDGMTYHTKESYKCIIEKEMNIFSNMLEVIHLWNNRLEKFNNRMVSYLRYNQLMKLNLADVDLKEKNLVRANLAEVNLKNSNLMNANLRSIFLARANLEEANLEGAYLEKANLTKVNLLNANLKHVYLMQAKLEEAVLENTNLKGANLEGANLNGANLIRAILENANLEGAELVEASLKNADLRSADLRGANLFGTDLRGANLSGAILANVKSLFYVRLEGANLVEVDLSEANLVGADISNMNLSGIKLEDAIMDEEQVDLLYEKYNLHKIRVYIRETDEIISYQTYCVRKFGK